jgi:hypothetical protein
MLGAETRGMLVTVPFPRMCMSSLAIETAAFVSTGAPLFSAVDYDINTITRSSDKNLILFYGIW